MKRLFIIPALFALVACDNPYARCNGDPECIAQVDYNLQVLASSVTAAGAAYEYSRAQETAYNAQLGHTVHQGGTVTTYDAYGPVWRGY